MTSATDELTTFNVSHLLPPLKSILPSGRIGLICFLRASISPVLPPPLDADLLQSLCPKLSMLTGGVQLLANFIVAVLS